MLFSSPETHIRLIAMDVDGVLTDGRLFMSAQGDELKAFHVTDGLGINLARKAGLAVAFITGRSSGAVVKRARELAVEELHQDVVDKAGTLEEIMRRLGLERRECAYIGDDINDLPAFAVAGLRIAVANAHPIVRKAADFVTERHGGEGAVREVIDHVLRKKGLLDKLVEEYFGGN